MLARLGNGVRSKATMVGKVIANEGKVVRLSQLIRSFGGPQKAPKEPRRMRISPNPTMDQVSQLLGQCGLPSDDILPEYLPNFVLARDGESDVGVAGLQVVGSTALVRSVAVVATHRRRGLGTELLNAVEQRARSQGVKQLFLLTNDAQAFFMARGYKESPRCSAPAEIQGCSQFGSSCCGAATLMVKQAEAPQQPVAAEAREPRRGTP